MNTINETGLLSMELVNAFRILSELDTYASNTLNIQLKNAINFYVGLQAQSIADMIHTQVTAETEKTANE